MDYLLIAISAIGAIYNGFAFYNLYAKASDLRNSDPEFKGSCFEADIVGNVSMLGCAVIFYIFVIFVLLR